MSANAQSTARADFKAWVAVVAGMIGAFLSILNIQLTNASLLDIEGGIGTGIDNGAWISTSYLIGEIIVIPMTHYLSRVFSFRRFLVANTILFMLFSIACSFTHDLGSMIVMRGLQGFAGGTLLPMAFTMVLTKLPKGQQAIGLAMFAVAVTFAPAIGPTIGGYLTENYGWQTIFYVNTLPSLVMAAMLIFSLEVQPTQLKLLREGDWAGITTMAIGLAALQTVLEEGNKDDWFESPFVLNLSLVAAVFLIAFIVIELKAKNPVVKLGLFTQRNFAAGVVGQIFVGFALFGSGYILPQYLGQVQRYNAQQIGEVVAWTGLPQLLLIPFIPSLMKRFDVRYVAIVGVLLFAASCFMNLTLSSDIAGAQFLLPNVLRAFGQAMILSPISAITISTITANDAGAASGISNMLRNLGGAIGTATIQTVITTREQYHSNIIGKSVTLYSEEAQDRIARLTSYFLSHGVSDAAVAQKKAIVAIGHPRETGTPIGFRFQRHMTFQPTIDGLAHEVVLGVPRLDAGGVDRLRTAFRALNVD